MLTDTERLKRIALLVECRIDEEVEAAVQRRLRDLEMSLLFAREKLHETKAALRDQAIYIDERRERAARQVTRMAVALLAQRADLTPEGAVATVREVMERSLK